MLVRSLGALYQQRGIRSHPQHTCSLTLGPCDGEFLSSLCRGATLMVAALFSTAEYGPFGYSFLVWLSIRIPQSSSALKFSTQ